MIATYAALQDWDAVYLFAYSHNNEFEKDHVASYFDVEGNWAKMAAMPLGSRIFLGENVNRHMNYAVQEYSRDAMLRDASASYFDIWKFVRRESPLLEKSIIRGDRFAISLDGKQKSMGGNTSDYFP